MKKILIIVLVFAFSLAALNFLPVHGEAEIYDGVIRLHVIANSDSEEDQSLKLEVRDAVLEAVSSLLDGCTDKASAERRVSDNLGIIREAAASVVAGAGYAYPVSVSLGQERYPEKSYESVCFPAGEYTSLIIKIGDAAGRNWWCVLFPGLCLSGAKEAERAFIEVGFTPEQYRIITETDSVKYKVRFRILEAFESAFS